MIILKILIIFYFISFLGTGIFLYKKNKINILVAFIFTYLFSLAINSVFFLILNIFNLPLKIEMVLMINIIFMPLIGLTFKKTKIQQVPIWGLLVILMFIIFVFVKNNLSFNNGYRLAIPSFMEDGANHFSLILDSLEKNKLPSGFYPFSFHGNAVFFIRVMEAIYGHVDLVFRTNAFVIYLWISLFVCLIFLYLIINKLISYKIRNNWRTQIISSFLFLLLGTTIVFSYVEFGFYSIFFSQIFSASLVYFLILCKEDYLNIWLFSLLIIAFYYSYSFLFPALSLFFIYLYLKGRDNKNLIMFLLSVLLSFLFIIRFLTISQEGINYLLTAPGGFPILPLFILFIYFVGGILKVSEINDKDRNWSTELYIPYLLCFIIYSVFIAIYQRLNGNFLTYSFYKTIYFAIIFWGVWSIARISEYLGSMSVSKENITIWLSILGVFILIWHYRLQLNPYLYDFISGNSNFFSNSKEKYNGIIYAIENFKYKNIVYIDNDYQSSRWGSLGYLPHSYNVITNTNGLDYRNYKYFGGAVKKNGGNTLILNPMRLLEAECLSSVLINTISSYKENSYIYPPVDLQTHERLCKNKVNE